MNRIGRVQEPGILSLAAALYLMAIGWALLQGSGTFLAGLFSGCGSIMTGVWAGLIISHQRGYSHSHDDDDTPGPIHHL